ncbi:MAG: nickel pincer cofactor biosynthesis protein LarC [Candidatus Dormibacteria bacterium]
MRAAYFDCLSGASGNMLLGAFLDAGAPMATLEATLAALDLSAAAAVAVTRRRKGNLEATHVEIEVRSPKPWRHVGEIDDLIAGSHLDEGVKERSRLAFRLLAQAEGAAHNISPDRVRLHEAGAIDAVIDVVGTFALADALGVEAFYCSALPLSSGQTESAHGVIPLPAPATVNILGAVSAPTYDRDGGAELVTPTGAAILAACAAFELPRLTTDLEGFGAGTADLEWPNVLRVVVGELEEDVATEYADAPLVDPGAGLREETISVLETNIDDMPSNLLAEVAAAMLEGGALDAYLTPILMKKGRAAHLLTVVCRPEHSAALAERLVRETTTLGVRVREQQRVVAERRLERMRTSIGEMAVKVKLVEGVVVDAVPEHDDVAQRAAELGLPVVEAHRRASADARRAYMEGDE